MKLVDIQKNTKISKEFPLSATILVSADQTVEPTTPLAKNRTVGGYRIIEAAKILKIMPAELKHYLKTSEGNNIYAGEVLAERLPVFPKKHIRIHAPSDGNIQTIDYKKGTILIKLIGLPKTTPSGLWGKINKIVKQESSTKIQILTDISKISTLAGRGFTREGILTIATARHENLEEYMLNKEMDGKIIVVGKSITHKALLRAIEFHVAGIVCGSLHYFDINKITSQSDIGLSIAFTEGYGEFSMNDETYQEFKRNEHVYAIIAPAENAVYCALAPGITPSGKNQPNRYKIVWGEQTGAIGELIKEIPQQKFANGLICEAIELQVKDSKIVIPRTNVTMIE